MKHTSAALTLLVRGLRGASVSNTGCYRDNSKVRMAATKALLCTHILCSSCKHLFGIYILQRQTADANEHSFKKPHTHTVHICSISFQSVTIPCYTGRKHHTPHTTHSPTPIAMHKPCLCLCLTSTGYLIFSSPLCSWNGAKYNLSRALCYFNAFQFTLTSALGPINTSPSNPPVITRACLGLPIL